MNKITPKLFYKNEKTLESLKKRIRKERDYRQNIEDKITNGIKVNLVDFAKYLRSHPTFGEFKLYHEFLNLRPEHFRRQHLIAPFIVDFYCHPLQLVIEIDGSSHENKYLYDINREQYLLRNGYYIARVTEYDVRKNILSVASFLADTIKFLYLLKKHNIFERKTGIKFEYSPLAFGEYDFMCLFSKEERQPVEDVFEDFSYLI